MWPSVCVCINRLIHISWTLLLRMWDCLDDATLLKTGFPGWFPACLAKWLAQWLTTLQVSLKRGFLTCCSHLYPFILITVNCCCSVVSVLVNNESAAVTGLTVPLSATGSCCTYDLGSEGRVCCRVMLACVVRVLCSIRLYESGFVVHAVRRASFMLCEPQ